MLVSLGAATITLLSFELVFTVHDLTDLDRASADPVRAVQAVVAAIGFLGGGAIIRYRGDVVGMTTAANIWMCGAIGMACGGGYYVVAVIAAGFTLVILVLVRMIERVAERRYGRRSDDG